MIWLDAIERSVDVFWYLSLVSSAPRDGKPGAYSARSLELTYVSFKSRRFVEALEEATIRELYLFAQPIAMIIGWWGWYRKREDMRHIGIYLLRLQKQRRFESSFQCIHPDIQSRDVVNALHTCPCKTMWGARSCGVGTRHVVDGKDHLAPVLLIRTHAVLHARTDRSEEKILRGCENCRDRFPIASFVSAEL